MHQPGFGIDADVGLGAKVILLALTGVPHLGIAGLRLILGRGWRCDEGGIHHGALGHQQAALTQHLVDGLKDRPGKARRFQQMAKLEQRGGVRYRCAAQIQAGKAPQRLTIVDGIFPGLISQTKPLRQAIETQHPLQPDGRPPRTLARLGIIMRTQLFQQPRPRYHDLHLREEAVPAGRLALGGIFGLGEGKLLGHETARGHGKDTRYYIMRDLCGLNKSVFP